jgi:hypothetical protein
MAVPFRELKESRETSTATGSLRSTTIVGQADVPPDQVNPTNVTGLPKPDDLLGWDPTQICYRVVAAYQPGSVTTSRITAMYSNEPPTFGGPGDPFFKSWTLSYYRVAQPMPYAVEDKRSYRYVDINNVTQTMFTYPVASVSHWESRMKFMRRCRVVNFASANWETIGNLSNKLVKIYNRWYLFTLSDVNEISRNTWDVTYTFEYDPGTPSGVFPILDDVLFPDGLGPARPMPGLAAFWCRPPFHEVRIIPGVAGGLPSWPAFFAVCPYEVLQTGHLTLPGFGPL